ncbi:2-keto-3-deoxy-L-rhamnonate aldolase RhmA [Pseudomonas hunanensis]|uniref:2-keto-3-deoxy-L-rhamnonate aldolase RhmA n=1 Tax=Pseudomonas hunanensis TaxID=1247546 RepID=A0ACC6JX96_9PSED|nr:2-keto-3-deoxy-L-rhamnonate aldolase RhmA [Pseudomonas hunanensis]
MLGALRASFRLVRRPGKAAPTVERRAQVHSVGAVSELDYPAQGNRTVDPTVRRADNSVCALAASLSG